MKKETSGTNFVPTFRTNGMSNTLQERYFRSLKEECAIKSASDAYYISAIACFCLTFHFPSRCNRRRHLRLPRKEMPERRYMMAGTYSKSTLLHQYGIRCSKFHIIDFGGGINIEVDYTDGTNTIPDCFFATAASDEDLKLLYEELGAYLRQKERKVTISPKNKIIKHDFTNSKK